MNRKTHWEHIHQTKTPTQVSWYQNHSIRSLQLIIETGVDKTGQIIDVGGGISTLVDDLLANGYKHVSVLDISSASLHTTRQRLGARAKDVSWLEADITRVQLPTQCYDVWHDRAVFHFLTHPEDRQRYVSNVKESVKRGGHVIVATFASDGPEKCSGLQVERYAPESLHHEFGEGFELISSTNEVHHTPFGTDQKFIYCYCRMN